MLVCVPALLHESETNINLSWSSPDPRLAFKILFSTQGLVSHYFSIRTGMWRGKKFTCSLDFGMSSEVWDLKIETSG